MISKRRFFFSCFWHKRYFILTKDGELKYFRNTDKNSRLATKISDVVDLQRVNEESGSTGWYKIVIQYDGSEDELGFYKEEIRNEWYNRMMAAKEEQNN